MDLILNSQVMKKDGQFVSGSKAVNGRSVILLYFYANWCPPCRSFTPLLVDFYTKVIAKFGSSLEVVGVSSDVDEERFYHYFQTISADWYVIPFRHETVQLLRKQFNVKGVPVVIVLKADGTLITRHGREEIQRKGLNVYNEWSSKCE